MNSGIFLFGKKKREEIRLRTKVRIDVSGLLIKAAYVWIEAEEVLK